jgi:hypothetical protein
MSRGRLAEYALSTDYAALWDLTQDLDVLCVARSDEGRWAACLARRPDGSAWRLVSSPGVSYVDARTLEDFVRQAAETELRWVVPAGVAEKGGAE